MVEIWQNGEDLGNVAVELEFLARAVCCAGMRRVDLQRRRDMCIDPKRPERVVEIEDDEARERYRGIAY